MKTGRSLTDLAAEIERQATAKRDFIADTRSLIFGNDGATLAMQGPDGQETFPVKPSTLRQIGDRVKIPAKYVDRMQAEAPELLARNVNHWFQEAPERRMIRVLDGEARAFLSDKYRPLDNFDLAQAVLPKLLDGRCRVDSCEITDRRMYIKAVVPDVKVELPPAGVTDFEWGKDHHRIDVISPGISISNSETGNGRLLIQPASWTAQCSNLAVFERDAMKKSHLGRVQGDGSADLEELFSDRTREISDAALWHQVADIVEAAINGDVFEKIVAELREARGQVITGNPVKAVEVLSNKFSLNEGETEGVLTALLRSGDNSKYGMHAAVTRMSQDVDDYDRASELEQLGAKVIELSPRDWQTISVAA